jgi:hypothetical protein
MADHRDGPSFRLGRLSFPLGDLRSPESAGVTAQHRHDPPPVEQFTADQVERASGSLTRFWETLPEDERAVVTYVIKLARTV